MDDGTSIVALGVDHHFCSQDEIASVSIGPDSANIAREAALKSGAKEAFIISTCNRVEVYVVGADSAAYEACMEALALNGTRSIAGFSDKIKQFTDIDAVKHLFEVACGIDSQMIGENEILGQIKSAYAEAFDAGHIGSLLNQVIQKAIQCSKWVRTNTQIGNGSTTVGAVVAELAGRIFDDFSQKNILLAGSGDVGKSVAMALAARGAKRITVSSRTWEKARSLSTEVEGSAIAFERIPKELHNFDIAIFALSNAPETVSFETALNVSQKRGNDPIFFVDLGVPQNVSQKSAELGNVFLYDFADLSKQANENIDLRKGEIERAQAEINRRAQNIWERIKSSD